MKMDDLNEASKSRGTRVCARVSAERVASLRSRIVAAAVGCALLVLAPTARADVAGTASPLASGTESPALQARAAQAYADTFNVSLSVAYDRVALQDATGPLASDIMSAVGSEYAGSWYDANDGGKLKIGVADFQNLSGAAGVDAATKIVAADEAQGDVEFVPVHYSLSQLLAAQRTVDADLAIPMAENMAQTSIDVEHNAVAIKTASALTQADDAAVQRAVSDVAAPVLVTRITKPTLELKWRNCNFQAGSGSSSELFCDPPLRGGPFIASAVGCTAGFLVWSNSDGAPYLMTAGHCLANDGGSIWKTRFSDGTLHNIGYKHSYLYSSAGDFGIIGIENPSGWQTTTGYVWVDGVPGQTSQNSFYHIGSTNYASAGQVVCDSSGPVLTTGYHTSCGVVQSGYHTDAQGVTGLIEFTGCSVDGTSGGPVYKNNIAYGILVAGNDCGDELYQPAPNAMSASGVHV